MSLKLTRRGGTCLSVRGYFFLFVLFCFYCLFVFFVCLFFFTVFFCLSLLFMKRNLKRIFSDTHFSATN